MKRCSLYFGLKPPEGVEHYPLIKIVPLNPPLSFEGVTHLIVTSQTTAELMTPPKNLTVLAVGKKTAAALKGYTVIIAKNECAEGVVELLKEIDPKTANILYPHSAKSRPVIQKYLHEKEYTYKDIALYDTWPQAPEPVPNLLEYREIIFTSPSTIDAFFLLFKTVPTHLQVKCIGPITRLHLTKKLHPASV